MSILAALPDPSSPVALGWILLSIASVAVAIKQVLDLTDRFKPSPPLHKEYATKVELRHLEDSHRKFREECRLSFDEAAATSRASREKIYLEQRRQAELLAKNTTLTELTQQRVQTQDTKIDRILERLPQRQHS